MIQLSRPAVVALVVLSATFGAACTASSGSADRVKPNLEVIDSTRSAFSAAITSINGTYQGCAGVTDGTQWSTAASVNSSLTYPQLTVQQNDSQCQLAITDVTMSDSGTLGAYPVLGLDASFQTSPSAFRPTAIAPAAFFANAQLSDPSYSTAFNIVFIVSETATENAGVVATIAPTTEVGTLISGDFTPPDYTTDTTALAVQVDGSQNVVSAAGTMVFTMDSSPALDYVIVDGQVDPESAGDVEAAWETGTAVTISDPNGFAIPAADFNLVGQSLSAPLYKTVILRVTASDSGLSSYELVQVTFGSPT